MLDGALGEVYHINWINRRHRARSGIEYQPQSRWFIDITKSGGGVVMDWGPYDFAAMSELLEPVRVDVCSAWIARPETAADPKDIELKTSQHASASLVFYLADGRTIPVTYERAACTHGHETNDIEIEGTRGAVRWDWLGGGKVHLSKDVAAKVQKTTTQHPDSDGLGPHDKPIIFFHRHVHGQSSPAIVNERAVFNFSCIRAIYDAAATGEPQALHL
jgi:predicted dehydrogenase